MTNFEETQETWSVKTPTWRLPDCQARGLRDEPRTVWVPLGRDCESTMRCLFHEFYELWLINRAGFNQAGASGPAQDRARAAESWVPDDCCECFSLSSEGQEQ